MPVPSDPHEPSPQCLPELLDDIKLARDLDFDSFSASQAYRAEPFRCSQLLVAESRAYSQYGQEREPPPSEILRAFLRRPGLPPPESFSGELRLTNGTAGTRPAALSQGICVGTIAQRLVK